MTLLEHFSFKDYPFSQTLPPSHIFELASENKVIRRLEYKLRAQAGVFKVMGAKGSGKSALAMMIKDRLKNNEEAVLIRAKDLGSQTLLERIGKEIQVGRKATLENVFERFSKKLSSGKNMVFIIDDADFLGNENLAIINEIMAYKNRLRFILIGSKRLSRLIIKGEFENISHATKGNFYLSHLSFFETIRYVKNEVEEVSEDPAICPFTAMALFWLAFSCQGRLKTINLVASQALNTAYEKDKKKIGGWQVLKAVFSNYSITLPFIPPLLFKLILLFLGAGIILGSSALIHQARLHYLLRIERSKVEQVISDIYEKEGSEKKKSEDDFEIVEIKEIIE